MVLSSDEEVQVVGHNLIRRRQGGSPEPAPEPAPRAQDFGIWGAEDVNDPPDLELDEHPHPPTSSSVGRVSDVDLDVDDDQNRQLSLAPSSVGRPSHGSPASSEDDSDEDEIDMDRRRLKVLQRMMPRVMIQKELARTQSAHNSHRKHKVGATHEVGGATQVGVAKRRVRASGVRESVEVRGDSESESDREEEKEGGPRNYEQGRLDVHVGRTRHSPLLLSSSDLDSSSDVGEDEEEEQSIHEEISDDEVTQWNARPDEWRLSRPHSNKERVKEPSLIDWMLGGTRTRRQHSSSKRRRRGGGGGKGEGRPRLARSGISVVVGGGGGGAKKRQMRIGHTRLGQGHGHGQSHSFSERQAGRHSFSNHQLGREKQHSFSDHRGHSESGPSRSLSSRSHPPTNPHEEVHAHAIPSATALDLQKAQAKAKQHKRKLAAANGAYTFDGGGRLTSGRRAEFVSLDVEDEGYSHHKKFVPDYRKRKRDASPTVQPVKQRTTLNDYFGQRSPSPSPPVLDLTHDDGMEPPNREEEGRRTRIRRRIEVDAGVRPLPVSVSFALESYVGRGRLRELLGTRVGVPMSLQQQPEPLQPEQPPHSPPAAVAPPPPFYIDGFVLSHTMSISDFAHAIPEKVSALIPHTSPPSQPGDGEEGTQEITEEQYLLWSRFLYSICLHFTWFASQTSSDEERGLLVQSARRMLDEAGKLEVAAGDGDVCHRLALDIRWTAVEVAFRMRFDCGEEDGARRFADHVKGFVEHLWLCDLESTFDAVAEAPSPLDYSHIEVRIFELWICLGHLFQAWDATTSNVAPSLSGCLEERVMRKYNAASNTSDDDYSASEAMWKTIYIVCAISQFSVFGSASAPSRS